MPSGFVARTWNSWLPSLSIVVAYGDVHGAKSAPSSEHSNVEPGWSALKSKLTASVVLVEAGPFVIVVNGAATTVHARVDGEPSTLPTMSTLRTLSVWSPGSTENDSGELHGSYAAPSSEHWNVSSAAGVALSEPENSNVASG